ncbi:hypothetical protein GGR57DRAFT_510514 [Xylariaceae sp. FL1272]|nr:hypothetical protein GGR57DRAFT_510514 [Xylariaceae sp. FL1272]
MAESNLYSLHKVQQIKQFSDLGLECGDETFNGLFILDCGGSRIDRQFSGRGDICGRTGFDLHSVKRMIDFMYTGFYSLDSYTASDVLLTSIVSQQVPTTEETQRGLGKVIQAGSCIVSQPTLCEVLFLNDAHLTANTSEHSNHETSLAYNQLIGHSRVNAIADYYEISTLKTESIEKTRRVLECSWSAKDFWDFVRASIGKTHNKQFHEMLGSIAVEHVKEIMKCGLLDDRDTEYLLETATNDYRSASQKWAKEEYYATKQSASFNVRILSSSVYALNIMNEWVKTGNIRDLDVLPEYSVRRTPNIDFIYWAKDLHDRITEIGPVVYG